MFLRAKTEIYVSANRSNIPLQSAHKVNHSAQTALLKIFNNILIEIDQRNSIMVILLNLSDALDTVNHEIILRLLCSRDYKSENLHVSCCVPQGPVLGLYSKYSLLLSGLISFLSLSYHCYADDYQIWTSLNPSDVEKHGIFMFSNKRL